ncbi:hypothetical protein ACH5Y9_14485 [Methylomonas sp. BW4-1]|uniref:Uncharacterized protein n=1 Tax=Methylomonas defluvii TaxID=3045149 RepID=A0ABU4UK78_9GAMM|nr:MULTISPECIES: hypothetical protein [unclassified Methylomonas]MDX8129893.1 hypothetical protein [Methylomonas sp. OY6]NOV30617.1 hypothetical protein [Methylomonas sp. ZR1]QBC26652.1 hypothetical protein U737_06855 [Methylomonas sp. LW13]QSB02512.1 hypothetical protein JWZ98_06100 [Methylomonas sp. EFPC1]
MATDKSKNDRKKIAVEEPTYDQLKNFSRFNGLKTRTVVACMVNIMLQDEVLSRRVVEQCLAADSEEAN